MARWSCIPRIAIVARMDSWVLQEPRLLQDRQHGFFLLLGRNEIDTRTCSYYGTKTERTLARCQYEMISNLQPDQLPWPATRKVKEMFTFLEVDGFDSDHWSNSFKQTWNGEVWTIERYMNRRCHPLHLRQPGRNPDNGSFRSQQNGTNHTKNSRTAKIGGKSNCYRLFQAMKIFFSQISRADVRECRARDSGAKKEHLTGRTKDEYF